MVADGAVEEEVNFPSGDELETEGDELGFLKNLDLNVEAMEGEEQSAAPMSSKVDSANLQEDLEQGQQPESRTSSKVAKYAYTDVRYRQYQRGLVSNPLFSGLDPEEKVTPSSMSNRGGETGAEEAGGRYNQKVARWPWVRCQVSPLPRGMQVLLNLAWYLYGGTRVWMTTVMRAFIHAMRVKVRVWCHPKMGPGGGMLRGAIWGPPTQKNAF